MKRDTASDIPVLADVTLLAVTSVALERTISALRASMQQCRFAEVLLLSDRPPTEEGDGIIWRKIETLRSRRDYSRFMLSDLAGHVSTGHALCIQWDGFVLDGGAWDPRFLDFDYIGAIWPHFSDGHNVGNGGFSLRSRRLLDACTSLPFDGSSAEDVVIGRSYRAELEMLGLRFAPEAIARRFAYERTHPTGTEFGFHGAFNLMMYISSREAEQLFREIEPNLLSRAERRELLWWALSSRHYRLALQLLTRLLSVR